MNIQRARTTAMYVACAGLLVLGPVAAPPHLIGVAWADDEGIPIHEEFTRSWASDLFHDRNHLDEAGAQRLSETVGAWLQDECDAGDLFADCGTGS